MKYDVYDELGELVRRFQSKEEAEHWCKLRAGYTWKRYRPPPKTPVWELLPEAPF